MIRKIKKTFDNSFGPSTKTNYLNFLRDYKNILKRIPFPIRLLYAISDNVSVGKDVQFLVVH